jgi:hypothetical protein
MRLTEPGGTLSHQPLVLQAKMWSGALMGAGRHAVLL